MKKFIIGFINLVFPDKLKEKLFGVWIKDADFRLWCKQKLINPDDLFMHRFLWSDIIKTLELIKGRFGKNYPIVLLTDRYDNPVGFDLPIFHFDNFLPACLNSPSVVICAFDSDEKLVSVLKTISRLTEVYYYGPFRLLPTARYFHRNDVARNVLINDYNLNHGKFDLADFENLIQAIDMTSDIVGDYLEIGVYRGDSAHLVLNYIKQKKLVRNCYFFDLFEGFTNESSQVSGDSVWANSHIDTSLESVKAYLCEFSNVMVEKLDIVSDSLPHIIQNIAVCNIDVDIYEATLAALTKVAPLIVKGGLMIVEDQGHTPLLAGAYLATCDFLNSPAANNFVPVHLDSGQMFFIRI